MSGFIVESKTVLEVFEVADIASLIDEVNMVSYKEELSTLESNECSYYVRSDLRAV